MLVILKPTSACNGTCVYCAASASDTDVAPLRAERLDDLFAAFAPWLREDTSRTLGLLWHGGEPLILGLDFYRAALGAQQRVFGDDVARVRNQFQSNLTLLTEAWIPFLRRFVHRGIGTSFDVVEDIRGIRSGDELGARWFDAVQLCREAGINVGVVYVVHKRSLPRAKDIYHFFRNLAPRMGVRYNPLYREGRATDDTIDDLAVTPEEYGAFLVEVGRLWWDDARRTPIAPHSEWYAAWQGRSERLCCENSGRCHETHLGIAPDGTAYACGRFSDHQDPGTRLGNVFTDPLTTILDRRGQAGLADRTDGLRRGVCGNCPYWPLCHGGCPMMARLYYGTFQRETYFCRAYQMLGAFFEERMELPPRGGGVPGGAGEEEWR